MAIMKMKRAVILAKKRDRKSILELLQRMELMEVAPGGEEDEVFRREDTSETVLLLRQKAQTAQRALSVLELWAPEKSGMLDSFAGREVLTEEEYRRRAVHCEEALTHCEEILVLEKRHAELAAELPKLEQQLIALQPWLLYDLPLSYVGTEKTAVFTGTLPHEVHLEELTEKLSAALPDTAFDANIVSAAKEQTCIFVVCGKKDGDQVFTALRKLGFARPPASDVNPAAQSAAVTEEKSRLQREKGDTEQALREKAEHREAIRFAADCYTLRAEKYQLLSTLSQSRRTFLVSGYLPEQKEAALQAALTPYDAVLEFEEPEDAKETPVLLKNNLFAEPCESIVEGYAIPAADSFDPSFIVALFYYILYGIMLSDAAYGIIMATATGLLLRKYPNMEKGLKRNIRLFFYCGIATTVAGFLFGSFFGDAVNVIATTFFHRPDLRLGALWMEPINAPMKMLVVCFAIAIIHLFVGLGCKLWICIRKKDYAGAVFDVVFWYLLVGGLIVLLMTQQMAADMFGIAPWNAVMAEPAKWCAIVGAVGIVLTGGRESKNIGARLGSGLYSLYGVSGYLSDILSYSRLMALGLATGVIAQVFNKMGSMLGGNLFGMIVFVLVFFIGHTMNILINALGAYVHTNRLTYVEFFGKFYEGGGRRFAPFAVNTKYFKFKEDL